MRPRRTTLVIPAVLIAILPAARSEIRPYLVADIAASAPPESSFPSEYAAANGYLFFRAYTPETGSEMWRTDGTPEGTILLADINPGPANGLQPPPQVSQLSHHSLDSMVIFPAFHPDTGWELWRSDGTAGG